VSEKESLPTNLIDAVRHFSDLDVCTEFVANLRELDDYGRFATVLRMAAGRRLTYAELTGQR